MIRVKAVFGHLTLRWRILRAEGHIDYLVTFLTFANKALQDLPVAIDSSMQKKEVTAHGETQDYIV